MRCLVFCLLLFVLVPTVRAEVPSHIALWGGIAADYSTTRLVIKHGGHEAGAAGDRARVQAAVVVSHGVMVEVLSYLARRAGHPKLAQGFTWINGGVHIGAATWNGHVYRTLRR